MPTINRCLLRLKRYLYRYYFLFNRQRKLYRIFKMLFFLLLAFLLMTLINGILFSSIIFLPDDTNEPDFDLDTRPHYKRIEEKKQFDESGNYIVVQDFIQYHANLTRNANLLALYLHTDIQQLHLLLEHAKIWDGPISISIYVKGTRGSEDIDYVSMWFRCNRRSFKVIHVHLVISAVAYQNSISAQRHSHNVKYVVSCKQVHYINHTDDIDSTPYPSNLLRNVPRHSMTNSTVQYVLSLDIDIFPSADLFHHLISFYTKNRNNNELFNRTLYVIPVFEIDINTKRRATPLPQNKDELILLWNDNHIQQFQINVCSSCQHLTNYKAWKEEKESDKILPLFRPHYSLPWKPYYVGPKDVPMFDQRFKMHAHARISQCCENYLAGYDYAVLNNVFLYHLGFLDKDQLVRTELLEDDTSLLLFQQFIEDKSIRYSNSSRKC